MSHIERCRAEVHRQAAHLADAIIFGRMNASAFEGIIYSFVEQPAYPKDARGDLIKEALELARALGADV